MSSAQELHKDTSAYYGADYQQSQLQKFLSKEHSHWEQRVRLAHDLVDRYVLPRFSNRELSQICVVDVGCSIGTFAIEFAQRGFNSFGIDFDPEAIDVARDLGRKSNVNVRFVCGDVAQWPPEFPKIDVAVCFDIFEHLHDDELGALLTALRNQLSEHGCLVFHTFPTEYQYIFFSKKLLVVPMLPFAKLPLAWFARLTKAYASALDIASLIVRGKTRHERIALERHCNLLTKERLENILKRSGYEIVHLGTDNLFENRPNRPWTKRWFAKQSITHNNLFGVAVGRRSEV